MKNAAIRPLASGAFCGALALGLVVSAGSAVAEETAIPCPANLPGPDLPGPSGGNTHWVPKFMATSSGKVPFGVFSYEYKRGNAALGRAWYWPDNRFTFYEQKKWEWDKAGVDIACRRIYYPPNYVDQASVMGIEGDAVVIPEANGPHEEEESWSGGAGYFGGGGETAVEECYDVFRVWVDQYGYHEVYLGEVCFRDGLMI
jgi:hypothetical protein